MKEYNIPIRWESYNRYKVEANNLQEAVEKALAIFLAIPDDYYMEESFDVDPFILEEHPDEEFDMDEAIQNINL